MKIFSKEHKKALELKHKMDEIEKEHLVHIKFQEQKEKHKGYLLNKEAEDKAFLMREAKFEDQEDGAYLNYYNFMHKHLNIDKNTDFSKYKDGFCDEKYINNMFKQKNAIKKQKRSVKK